MPKTMKFAAGDIYSPYSANKNNLNADKMRCHILECLGIYISFFGSHGIRSSSPEHRMAEDIEATKSKIFLLSVRDIVSGSFHYENASNQAVKTLVSKGFLVEAKTIQIESESDRWFPLHWAGLVEGVCVNDVRLLLGE
jgi:hypothetical protein